MIKAINPNVRHHRCDGCGQLGPWTDSWQWYGSYNDLDNGRRVLKMCSEACHETIKAQGGAPRVLAKLRRAEAA